MKTINLEQFQSIADSVTVSVSGHKDLHEAIELCEDINKHYPATLEIILDDSDGIDSFHRAEIRLANTSPGIYISRGYTGQYSFYTERNSIPIWSDPSGFAEREAIKQAGIELPNNVKVLSTKKIQAWVNYLLAKQAIYQAISDNRQKEKDQFLEELLLSGQHVHWHQTKIGQRAGYIRRGGLEFSITEHKYGFETRIQIIQSGGLSSFLAMSNNLILKAQGSEIKAFTYSFLRDQVKQGSLVTWPDGKEVTMSFFKDMATLLKQRGEPEDTFKDLKRAYVSTTPDGRTHYSIVY